MWSGLECCLAIRDILLTDLFRYYGSYFKNTDLWIVMEYCGAGSVSDIMR